MKVRYFIPILLLIILFISGCGNFGTENNYSGEEKTLQITGVPYQVSTFDLKLYIRKDAQLLKTYQYTNRDASQVYNETISVADSATSITAYMYIDSKPVYFAYTDCTPSQTNYSFIYWMDYDKYFTRNELVFGVSETQAQNVNSSISMNVNLNNAPYYLVKLPNVLGQCITVNATVIGGGSVKINYGSDIKDLTDPITPGSAYIFQKYTYNCLYVLIQPTSYDTTLPIVDFQIYSLKSTSISGYISDMVSGDTPDVVYAINHDNNTLYYINPLTKEITQTYNLPYIQPKAMAYSATDKKVYIIGDNSSSVTIWDLTTKTYSQVNYSNTYEYGRDIIVGPNARRIYVLSNSKLYIMNMDSPFEVKSSISISSYYLEFDENNAKLYITGNNYLNRYSVLNDSIASEQIIPNSGYSIRNLVLSPDKTKLILPSYESSVYMVNAYDTTDFTNVLGHWDIGNPGFVGLSPDGSILYAYNRVSSGSYYYNDYIYVMDTQNYSLIRKLPLPYSYTRFTSNSDGSVLVVYDDSYTSNNYIFYYEDIKKVTVAQTKTVNLKNIISKLTAEKDLSPSNL